MDRQTTGVTATGRIGGKSRRVALRGLLPVVALAGALTGCSASSGAAGLPDCTVTVPASGSAGGTARPVTIEVLWADSASQRSTTITQDRLASVRQEALVAAACEARLTVKLVAGQADPLTLYSGDPHQHGGTRTATARLSARHIDQTVMPQVSATLEPAMAKTPHDQESPADLFQVAADDATTGGAGLAVVVLSDMVAHTPQVDLNRAVTAHDAVAAVQRTPLPDLSSSRVDVFGAGGTTDAATAPTDWLAAVRGYAGALCTATHAAGCVVTTQYPTQS